jgi:hypothetical protein
MTWYEWLPTWQDATMMVANVIFIIGVIPMMRQGGQKPELSSSIWITIGMTLMVAGDASNKDYWSASFMGVNTVQWAILAWQRWQLDLKVKKRDSE